MIDGNIPTKAKDDRRPSTDNKIVITSNCMKFPLILCAYYTKVILK